MEQFDLSKFSSKESVGINEEEFQERAIINDVKSIDIHPQYIKRINANPKNIITTLYEGMTERRDMKTVSEFSIKPNDFDRKFHIRKPAISSKEPIENDCITLDQTTKFGTLNVVQKLRFVKTDGVAINLDKVRIEMKGTLENKYTVLYTLGVGAFGNVQKIRDNKTDEIRAVKIISKNKCHMDDNFNLEIEILKKLVL